VFKRRKLKRIWQECLFCLSSFINIKEERELMKRFQVRIVVLILTLFVCGTAFAFPRDLNPSTINNTQFPGDWTNTLRSTSLNSLRVLHFLDWEFKTQGGGPNGPKDLKIWDTPSFAPHKVSEDASSWARLMANPGSNVPAQYGKSIFTTHDEMISYLESLPKDFMTLEYLGEVPQGFPLPFVIFSKESKPHTPEKLAKSGKPLVWVLGLIHGGEWSASESVLATAADLARQRPNSFVAEGPHAGTSFLDHINVVLWPRICADGAKRPSRETYDLVSLNWTPQPEERDLNRDNMLFDLPVSRILRKMKTAYRPHITVNLHERGSATFTSGVETRFRQRVDNDAGDIGLSASNTLVLPKDYLSLFYDYVAPDMLKFAPKYGIEFGMYREGTDTYAHGILTHFAAPETQATHGGAGLIGGFITSATWDPDAPYMLISEAAYNTRNARNHNGMDGCISLLFENKGGPSNVGNRGAWERRVATSYVCTMSVMTTMVNRPELMEKINNMRNTWAEKGKKVTADDTIPLYPVPPTKHTWLDRERTVVDLDINHTATSGDDIATVTRYDWTKSLKRNPTGTGTILDGQYDPVKDNSGSRERQPFKLELLWQGTSIKNRIRPYAYLIDGPYAGEIVTRMMVAGIEVKRLASDVTIEVEAGSYAARTVFRSSNDNRSVGPYVDMSISGSDGWLNRDINVFTKNKTFKKDETFVIYLGQLLVHLIPMYMEWDFTWNAASCIYLPRESVALKGASTRNLHADLVGWETPVYRYLKEVNLPTYDVDHFLPLINRGGVTRFFSYQTQDNINAVAKALKMNSDIVKVFDYDIQLHMRTNAVVNGKFDIALPTRGETESYMIQKKDGTYEPLKPHSTMVGLNVATITVANHGLKPWTVDLDSSGQPVVGDSSDGNYRVLPRPLPANDDLYGFRIVEILKGEDKEESCLDKLLDGCNAGYAAFAFLALLPLFARRSKK
jgi:Synergist-CTERM protein sorting domain-containing protein